MDDDEHLQPTPEQIVADDLRYARNRLRLAFTLLNKYRADEDEDVAGLADILTELETRIASIERNW